MGSKSAEIFKAIKDHDLLSDICESRLLIEDDDSKKTSSQLVKMLSRECATIGLKKFLETLKLKQLQKIGANMEWDNDKVPSSKMILAKRIHEEMEKEGPKKFLEDVKYDVIEEIFVDMEIDKPSSKSKYADALIDETEVWGLEKVLMGLPVPKLKDIAEACGLKVESGSLDVLVDCIVKQENHKAAKKKSTKQEKVSKKKPDIKKGISKTDLNTHYYRQELLDYCKDHDLKTTGNKKDFIARILAHVEDRPQPRLPKKPGTKRSKRKKTSDDEKSEKSDKSGDEKPTKKKAKKNEKSTTKSDKSDEESDKKKKKKEEEKEKVKK